MLPFRDRVARVVRDVLFPPERLFNELRSSEDRHQSVGEWWETHHQRRAKFWLSGSRPGRVWRLLGIVDLIRPGTKVLNIGVGLGHCTRELAKRGCQVDALDISPTALERVAKVTNRGWTPAELSELPSDAYDLAISFLVAQHMSNAGLQEQLFHVVRSLLPGGVFAIQVSFPLDAGLPESDGPAEQKSGSVLRTVRQFSEMVNRAGGEIARQSEIGRFSEYKSGWMAYQVVKK